jgi:hypothetical protein
MRKEKFTLLKDGAETNGRAESGSPQHYPANDWQDTRPRAWEGPAAAERSQ